MYSLVLKGESGRLEINNIKWENSAADNRSDASWLNAKVYVEVLGFKASFCANFTIQNFDRFLCSRENDTLSINKENVLIFDTEEEQLKFTIKINSLGNALIHGTAASDAGKPDAVLNFKFNTDFFSVENYLEKISRMCANLKENNKFFE